MCRELITPKGVVLTTAGELAEYLGVDEFDLPAEPSFNWADASSCLCQVDLSRTLHTFGYRVGRQPGGTGKEIFFLRPNALKKRSKEK